MKIYGLIGNPVAHSLSPKYFNDKFRNEGLKEYEYMAFKLDDIDEFPALLEENPEIAGLNVTIPYKGTVQKYLDKIDRDAKLVGSVNTIKIIHHRKKMILHGYNTDVFGIESSLAPYFRKDNTQALILGTGGAAKAVTFVLKKYGISYQYVTRRPLKANQIVYWGVDKSVLQDHLLIINTTPLGMHPGINDFPDIPYEYLTGDHILLDLIYNPPETRFLSEGKKAGATTINGMKCFLQQAERSWSIWNK